MTTLSAALTRFVTLLIIASLGLIGVTTAPPAVALVDDKNPTTSWRPANGIAYSQARVGDMIVLGGTFTSMRSPSGQTVTRNRLAAISATTGELLPWNPNPNGTGVRTVAASADGGTVYVGGTFTSVGGAARTNAAALSAATGTATPFIANANSTVRQIRVIDGRLYLVGTFWKVNGVGRGNGAEVDPATGALRTWDPKVTAGLVTVAGGTGVEDVNDDGIYVGGYFSAIGGVPRDHVAKVDRASGALMPWTSGSTCQDSTNPCDVWDILATPDSIYLAQGGPGGRIVSLDPQTGAQRWWTGGDGDFTSVLRDGTKLYAAGHFADAVGGVPRAGVVVLDARTGGVLPDLTTALVGGSGVWQLLLDGGMLRACGQFTTVGSTAVGKFVSFPVVADPPDLAAPQAPGSLRIPAALSDQVTLSWAAAVDDVATIHYRVRRDGVVIGNPAGTTFKDRTVVAGATHTYTVEALDSAGNVSAPSRAITVTTESGESQLLQRGASWAFLSLGTTPGSDWTTLGFDQSSWATGVGEFGYGDGDEDTVISPKGVTHYFRTKFSVSDPTNLTSATLRLLVDDGAVVHLNGSELTRTNMPSGPVTNDTVAAAGVFGTSEMTYQSIALPVSSLRPGPNQLAIEVHNASASSSDISFDAFVTATTHDDTPGDPTDSPTEHNAPTPTPDYVAAGSPWRYLDGGAATGPGWDDRSFDDSAWRVGAAQLGYGDGDEATLLSYGTSSSDKPITSYFRTAFEAGDSVSDVRSVRLRALVDDGAVVFLNGQEIWRFNLPDGPITSTTQALTAVAGSQESRWNSIVVPDDALLPGRNVVAVELHQHQPGSSDVSLDLELTPVR